MSDSNNDSTRTSAVRSPPGIVSRIRTYFLTGLVVAGPVAVTLWLVWWFVSLRRETSQARPVLEPTERR